MTIPPNAHIILGAALLGFIVCLAIANWSKWGGPPDARRTPPSGSRSPR